MSAALHLLEGARTGAEYLLFLLLFLEGNFGGEFRFLWWSGGGGGDIEKTREERIAQVDDADVFFSRWKGTVKIDEWLIWKSTFQSVHQSQHPAHPQSRAERKKTASCCCLSRRLRAAPAARSQSGSVARGAAPGEPGRRRSGLEQTFEEILTQTAAGNTMRPDTAAFKT